VTIALFDATRLALPTGKQNTAAHHSVPAFVLAVPATLPVSLQAAFEAPAQAKSDSGYLEPSIDALLAEHRRVIKTLPSRFDIGRYVGSAPIAPEPTDRLEQSSPATTRG
jgi:hypothetical protein